MLGQYYLHYEMSGIGYFDLSLRWIETDIVSISLRSFLQSFNASRDVGRPAETCPIKANRRM